MSSSIMFSPIIRKGNHSENFLPWFLPICPSPLTPEESHIFKLSEGHQKNPTVYIFPAWLANANISPCRTPREFLYQGWKSQIQTLLPTSAVKEYIENHWEINEKSVKNLPPSSAEALCSCWTHSKKHFPLMHWSGCPWLDTSLKMFKWGPSPSLIAYKTKQKTRHFLGKCTN